jgi:hypothetical protein
MFALGADHTLNPSQREMNLRFLNTYRPTLKFTASGQRIRQILFPLGVSAGRFCKRAEKTLHIFIFALSMELRKIISLGRLFY